MTGILTTMRCFIAVTVGERITGPVAAVVRELRAAAERAGVGSDVAWARPEGWHVTLKFLGRIDRMQSPAPETAAREVESQAEPKAEPAAPPRRAVPPAAAGAGGSREHPSVEALAAITSAVERVVSSHSAFDVRARGVLTFPRASSPRVIAVGMRDDGSLARLAAGVDGAVASLGFERERRPFTPHLTLGRVRRARDAGGRRGAGWAAMRPVVEKMRDIDLGTDRVREVDLFESELGPGGARYVRRAGFRLND